MDAHYIDGVHWSSKKEREGKDQHGNNWRLQPVDGSGGLQPGVAVRGEWKDSSSTLVDTAWTVNQLGDEAGSTFQLLSLAFVGRDRLSGHDGCNVCSRSLTVKDFTPRISDKLVGMMAVCSDAVEGHEHIGDRTRGFSGKQLASMLL